MLLIEGEWEMIAEIYSRKKLSLLRIPKIQITTKAIILQKTFGEKNEIGELIKKSNIKFLSFEEKFWQQGKGSFFIITF